MIVESTKKQIIPETTGTHPTTYVIEVIAKGNIDEILWYEKKLQSIALKKNKVALKKKPSLHDLLHRLDLALDDWMRMYAPEFCDGEKVEETRNRIRAKGGTLAYIASLRQEIREKLGEA